VVDRPSKIPADGEAEEILYPISFQQRCKRTSSGCLIEIETDVPIYARMRAALANLDEGEFTEGHELDHKWRDPVPSTWPLAVRLLVITSSTAQNFETNAR
jgi:hypothetical protein